VITLFNYILNFMEKQQNQYNNEWKIRKEKNRQHNLAIALLPFGRLPIHNFNRRKKALDKKRK
jgi:hypothetical protein